jgi:hypothetical protein
MASATAPGSHGALAAGVLSAQAFMTTIVIAKKIARRILDDICRYLLLTRAFERLQN